MAYVGNPFVRHKIYGGQLIPDPGPPPAGKIHNPNPLTPDPGPPPAGKIHNPNPLAPDPGPPPAGKIHKQNPLMVLVLLVLLLLSSPHGKAGSAGNKIERSESGQISAKTHVNLAYMIMIARIHQQFSALRIHIV